MARLRVELIVLNCISCKNTWPVQAFGSFLGISPPTKPTFRLPIVRDSLHIVTPCIFCVTDGGSV